MRCLQHSYCRWVVGQLFYQRESDIRCHKIGSQICFLMNKQLYCKAWSVRSCFPWLQELSAALYQGLAEGRSKLASSLVYFLLSAVARGTENCLPTPHSAEGGGRGKACIAFIPQIPLGLNSALTWKNCVIYPLQRHENAGKATC